VVLPSLSAWVEMFAYVTHAGYIDLAITYTLFAQLKATRLARTSLDGLSPIIEVFKSLQAFGRTLCIVHRNSRGWSPTQHYEWLREQTFDHVHSFWSLPVQHPLHLAVRSFSLGRSKVWDINATYWGP
jgi:hypothetical protein